MTCIEAPKFSNAHFRMNMERVIWSPWSYLTVDSLIWSCFSLEFRDHNHLEKIEKPSRSTEHTSYQLTPESWLRPLAAHGFHSLHLSKKESVSKPCYILTLFCACSTSLHHSHWDQQLTFQPWWYTVIVKYIDSRI